MNNTKKYNRAHKQYQKEIKNSNKLNFPSNLKQTLNETWKYKKPKALECGITWIGGWTWEWRSFMMYKIINIPIYHFIMIFFETL